MDIEEEANDVITIKKVEGENKTRDDTVVFYAKTDSVSMYEVKHFIDENFSSIFNYYTLPEDGNYDEYDNWSQKMFGRCCTETDLTYSEILSFKIESNIKNSKYPISNLSDTKYRTAYVFKENENQEIKITLNPKSYYFNENNKRSPNHLLEDTDTILSPFKLSLINGYVKSQKTFQENNRIKTLEILHNKKYVGTVKLLDVPEIQEFTLEKVVFFKNDTLILIPKTYYKGSKYEDVCISEIQTNLGTIAHYSINKKYKLWEE